MVAKLPAGHYQFLLQRDVADENPVELCKRPKRINVRDTEAFNDAELKEFFRLGIREAPPLHKAALLLLFTTEMRNNELRRINLDQITGNPITHRPCIDYSGDVMEIGHIELMVGDPVKSQKFYEEVLGFTTVLVQEAGTWMKLGEREILLRRSTDAYPSNRFEGAASNIVFYSNDLEADKATLIGRGVKFRGYDRGCDIFTDLDGHWFQLVDPNHA